MVRNTGGWLVGRGKKAWERGVPRSQRSSINLVKNSCHPPKVVFPRGNLACWEAWEGVHESNGSSIRVEAEVRKKKKKQAELVEDFLGSEKCGVIGEEIMHG